MSFLRIKSPNLTLIKGIFTQSCKLKEICGIKLGYFFKMLINE